jgi:hypothetical protein
VPRIPVKRLTRSPDRHRGSGSHRAPARVPEWLREYIEDQGQFALLQCGHKENLNDKAVLLIVTLAKITKQPWKNTQVFCERCNQFTGVDRHMKFHEYAGIPERPETDIPLF